jgi:uncharacterized MAPEG superfamily protein
MDVPLACVAGAFLLIYAPRLIVARAQVKAGYDNRDPRGQQAKLDGAARRANAAHNNSFEAFAPFAAAVIACEIRGADPKWTEILSLAFVALRVLYVLAYVGDRPSTRSTIWSLAFACVIALFAFAVFRL